jgi:hypothetical protein
MDISTIIAAAPVVRRAWKYTPSPLRVPLIVAGVAFVAWRWFADQQADPTTDGADVAAA